MMMLKWIYRLSDNVWLYGGGIEPSYNAGTQGLAVLPRNPQRRTERHDGAGGIRDATDQEISDYDAEHVTTQALARFDDEKLVKALAIWTAGKLNVALPTAKSEILQIYRGL